MTFTELLTIKREFQAGAPRTRRERATLWVPVLEEDAVALERRCEQITADYREALEIRTGLEARPTDIPHVDPEATRQALWVRRAGFAIMAIETILAVGVSIWSLTLWPVLSGVIGGFIAIAWTVGGLGVHYGRSDSVNPSPALRSARWGILFSFVVSLLGLAPVLLARTVPDAAALTGVATAVITLGFSSLAAYLFFQAFLIDWAAPYAREYDRVQRELALTNQLRREAREVAAGRFPLRPSWASSGNERKSR